MARGRTKKTTAQLYKPSLCKLMAWLHQHPAGFYDVEHEFTQEELLAIQADDLAKFMRLMAYDKTDPGPEDHPTKCRSTTLEYFKKAISHFMPHKFAYWNVESNFGNPTKSNAVNAVIKMVRLAEVRRQGLPSNAKRDIKKNEFELTLKILEQDPTGDPTKTRMVPTMEKVHFNLIARTDDICNIETEDLSQHPRFSDCALETKVWWSKNVTDERECPAQIILFSNDTNFCCGVALASHLEERIGNGEQSRFLFGAAGRNDEDEPGRINSKYTGMLRKIWKENPEMQELIRSTGGALGSHSIRKFGATWCSEHGCADIEVEVRGRWRGKKNGRVVNRYINPRQTPTDVRVAALLCPGGPIKYKIKGNSNVTHQFLIQSVVPNIAQRFGADRSNRIADVLGPALLWVCHEPGFEHLVSDDLREWVQAAYNRIRGDNPADYNPVEKVPLHVYRVENDIRVEERVQFEGMPENFQAVGGSVDARRSVTQQQLQTVIVCQNRLEQVVKENHQQAMVSLL